MDATTFGALASARAAAAIGRARAQAEEDARRSYTSHTQETGPSVVSWGEPTGVPSRFPTPTPEHIANTMIPTEDGPPILESYGPAYRKYDLGYSPATSAGIREIVGGGYRSSLPQLGQKPAASGPNSWASFDGVGEEKPSGQDSRSPVAQSPVPGADRQTPPETETASDPEPRTLAPGESKTDSRGLDKTHPLYVADDPEEGEAPAPERGGLPPVPVRTASAKNATQMPAVPTDGQPAPEDPAVAEKKARAQATAERRRKIADLRGIHPSTRVHFDAAGIAAGADKNEDGRMSPDEWANMPQEARARIRREAHDLQRANGQANYRDGVAATNMARLEGMSFGTARAMIQSGRADKMIADGNAMMLSPDSAMKARGEAMVAQGNAMKSNADMALKFHETQTARQADAAQQGMWAMQMMNAMGHRHPIVAATAAKAVPEMLGQQGALRRADAQLDVTKRGQDIQAETTRQERESREGIEKERLAVSRQEIDAKIGIAEKELAAAKLSRDAQREEDAKRHLDELLVKREELKIRERAVSVDEGVAKRAEQAAGEPERQKTELLKPLLESRVEAGGPSLQDQERDFNARLAAMKLDENQEKTYRSEFERYAVRQLLQRVWQGGPLMRASDISYLSGRTHIVDPNTGGVVGLRPRDAFIADMMSQYSGDDADAVADKLGRFHDSYTKKYKERAGEKKSASVGTPDEVAFTA